MPEARKVPYEVHVGECGAHQSGPRMRMKIQHIGYFWPTMTEDCIKYASSCLKCQEHGNLHHKPPVALHSTVSSWPFAEWGTDVVGPFETTANGYQYILAATDYFSKWAEAIPLREVTGEATARFFRNNIIHRFGIPARIKSDNGPNFRNQSIYRLV